MVFTKIIKMSQLFESERLIVRPLSKTDLEGFHDLESNPRVLTFVGVDASPHEDIQESIDELDELISAYSEKNNRLTVWSVIRKLDQEFIGTCAYIVDENGNEIGFRLREKHWGNGYATELVPKLINYVFETFNIDSIWAEADVQNEASNRILEKFLTKDGKRWNEHDQCWDYYYSLKRAAHEEN